MGSHRAGADGERGRIHSSVDDDPPSTTQIREAQLAASSRSLELYHARMMSDSLHQRMCAHADWSLVARCDGCGMEVTGPAAAALLSRDDS